MDLSGCAIIIKGELAHSENSATAITSLDCFGVPGNMVRGMCKAAEGGSQWVPYHNKR